ncbi:hypothetical protein [Bordetella petrii]|uniref:hypothetical protein n=1 Tax=Bordetella petrii TaxID=94624 RepID=UPI003730648C
MANFIDALVHAELFLLGADLDPTGPAQADSPGDTASADNTIFFSAADYRSAAG